MQDEVLKGTSSCQLHETIKVIREKNYKLRIKAEKALVNQTTNKETHVR